MNRTNKSKVFSLLVALAMVAGLLLAFPMAASADEVSDANPTVQFDVKKIFETKQAGKWPVGTAPTFNFTLTSSAYANGPADTSAPFTAYTAANLPMPGGAAGGTATLAIDQFNSTETSTTQTLDAVFDTITYTQSGVYTYTIAESTATGSKVPGVVYDSGVYYLNVYVENVVDEDTGLPIINTGTGMPYVTISAVTVYKNTNELAGEEAGGDTSTPDPDRETDGKIEIVTPGDDDGDDVDDGGNEDSIDVDTDAVIVQTTLTNTFDIADFTIAKTVTGGQADVTKPFSFDIALVKAAGGADTSVYAYEIYDNGTTPTLADSGNTSNTGTTTVQLKHNQFVKVYTPYGTKATVTETDASATGYKTSIVGVHGTASITPVTDAESSRTLGQQIIASDGANTQDFVNNMESITPTGVFMNVLPYAVVALLAGLGIFLWLFAKRRRNQEPEQSNGGL